MGQKIGNHDNLGEKFVIQIMWDNLFKGDKRKKTIFTALKGNILFQDLSDSQVTLLQNLVNVRHYRAGEVVFHQSEIGVGMYIIVSGSVDIFVEEVAAQQLDIKQNFVTHLIEGDFFGEMALVEEAGKRTASVVCREDCVLVGFFKPDLFEIINRSPETGVKILFRLSQVLATRLAETTAMIKSLKGKSGLGTFNK